MLDGEMLSSGKGYNKKDASQAAAQVAVEKLGIQ
jgi:ribonuclease-3